MSENTKKETWILDSVRSELEKRIGAELIHTDKNYSVENALQAAWFKVQETKGGKDAGYKPALEICDPVSISKALFKMVSEGLNPHKHQCSFIIRKAGVKWNLDYQREYQGTVALAKRYSDVKHVRAREIYEKDEYLTEVLSDGRKILKKHVQNIMDMDGVIIGAYCVIIDKDGDEVLTEMTKKMIEQAWNQGSMKGSGDVHKDFEAEMCKKTVINRACKPYINASNDAAILPEDYKGRQINPEAKKLSIPAQEIKQIESKPKNELKSPDVPEKVEDVTSESEQEEIDPYA